LYVFNISVLSFAQHDRFSYTVGLSAGIVNYEFLTQTIEEEEYSSINTDLSTTYYGNFIRKYEKALTWGVTTGISIPIIKLQGTNRSFGLAANTTFQIYFDAHLNNYTSFQNITPKSTIFGELEIDRPIFNQSYLFYYRTYQIKPLRNMMISTGLKYNSSRIGKYFSPILKIDCGFETGIQIGFYSAVIPYKTKIALSNGQKINSSRIIQHGVNIVYVFRKR
jgi:hypothetical protein